MRVNSILLLLSLSFVATISSINVEEHPASRSLLAVKGHKQNHVQPQHHSVRPHPDKPKSKPQSHTTLKSQPKPKPEKKKEKTNKKSKAKKNKNKKMSGGIVKKLSLSVQPEKPSQPKYFFDDIFSGFDSLEDFQQTFPAEYFSFASQKFTANTILVNIRGTKINPVGFFEQGVQNAFNTPGIEFVSVDEINPNSFAPKIKGKYNQKILYSNANLFLQKLKSYGENPLYQGRINLFVTNVSPRFFRIYPGFATFIGELLRLAHNNYIGIIYGENYRAPITEKFGNVCLISSNNRQGCIDSLNAPLNSYQWSSTKNNPVEAIQNFRNLMKTLCAECNVNKLVMPTYGLSNINGVSINNCFKKGGDCRNDLIAISDLITKLIDEPHVAFYGAAHLTDTRNLIIQNGNYYDVEAFYCEIIDAAYPELGHCE